MGYTILHILHYCRSMEIHIPPPPIHPSRGGVGKVDNTPFLIPQFMVVTEMDTTGPCYENKTQVHTNSLAMKKMGTSNRGSTSGIGSNKYHKKSTITSGIRIKRNVDSDDNNKKYGKQ